MNLLLISSLQDFFSQPKWFLTPQWFLFLFLFWMSAISAGVGISCIIRDKKFPSKNNYPIINYWLHLIPVIGYILGIYMLFTGKPLLKFELLLRMQKLLKKILPRTKHF